MEYKQDSSQSSQPYSVANEESPLAALGFAEPQDDTPLALETNNTTLIDAVQQLIGTMEQLRQDFDAKIKYDASKERQIDSLHSELQAYRAGLYFKILRPVILDLISMHDDLNRLIEGMPRGESMVSVAQVLKNLEIVPVHY